MLKNIIITCLSIPYIVLVVWLLLPVARCQTTVGCNTEKSDIYDGICMSKNRSLINKFILRTRIKASGMCSNAIPLDQWKKQNQ